MYLYEVIVMNRSNGRVRRKMFNCLEIAESFLNTFREEHEKNWRNFRAEIVHRPDGTSSYGRIEDHTKLALLHVNGIVSVK